MQGENGYSIFGGDLKWIEITGAVRGMKCNPKRIKDLMRDLRVILEPNDNQVAARISFAKNNALEFRARNKLGPDAVEIDGFQFHHCPGPLFAEPLAKGRPISKFYFMYHVLDLIGMSGELSDLFDKATHQAGTIIVCDLSNGVFPCREV